MAIGEVLVGAGTVALGGVLAWAKEVWSSRQASQREDHRWEEQRRAVRDDRDHEQRREAYRELMQAQGALLAEAEDRAKLILLGETTESLPAATLDAYRRAHTEVAVFGSNSARISAKELTEQTLRFRHELQYVREHEPLPTMPAALGEAMGNFRSAVRRDLRTDGDGEEIDA